MPHPLLTSPLMRDLLPLALGAAFAIFFIAFGIHRNRKLSQPMTRIRRDALFAADWVAVLALQTPSDARQLWQAAEAVGPHEAEKALQVLEHPDTRREWATYPEYWLVMAHALRNAERPERAVAAAREAFSRAELSARWVANAWCLLRELGETPPSHEANRVLGVIAEVGERHGSVAFVAYQDGEAARHLFNRSVGSTRQLGGEKARAAAVSLVQAGGAAAAAFHAVAEYPPPPAGRIRFTLLTPAGLRTTSELEEWEAGTPAHPLHGACAALKRLSWVARDAETPPRKALRP